MALPRHNSSPGGGRREQRSWPLLTLAHCSSHRCLSSRCRRRAVCGRSDCAVAVAHAYLRFAFDEPRLFRLIFSSARLHGTEEAKSSYRAFEQAVKTSQKHGALPTGATTMLAHALWSSMHGVADLVLSGSFGERHGQDVARVLLRAVFQGLRVS